MRLDWQWQDSAFSPVSLRYWSTTHCPIRRVRSRCCSDSLQASNLIILFSKLISFFLFFQTSQQRWPKVLLFKKQSWNGFRLNYTEGENTHSLWTAHTHVRVHLISSNCGRMRWVSGSPQSPGLNDRAPHTTLGFQKTRGITLTDKEV